MDVSAVATCACYTRQCIRRNGLTRQVGQRPGGDSPVEHGGPDAPHKHGDPDIEVVCRDAPAYQHRLADGLVRAGQRCRPVRGGHLVDAKSIDVVGDRVGPVGAEPACGRDVGTIGDEMRALGLLQWSSWACDTSADTHGAATAHALSAAGCFGGWLRLPAVLASPHPVRQQGHGLKSAQASQATVPAAQTTHS